MSNKKYLVLTFLIIFLILLFKVIHPYKKPFYKCYNCNLILIVVDALRADHLSYYGYERNTSPNIDKLANKSIVFLNAFAQSTFTLSSFMSFLTSLYPSRVYNFSLNPWNNSRELSLSYTTYLNLPEILRKNGYYTLAFMNNPHSSSLYGFNKGFDYFDEKGVFDGKYAIIESVNERIVEKLKEVKGRKFFLFIHYMDVHCPYTPPKPYLSMYDSSNSSLNLTGKCGWTYFNFVNLTQEDVKRIIAAYDGEIRYTDEHIGKLIKKMEELNLLNKTIIILTADHGEELKDHGFIGHGHSLYNELIHVPLIIYHPRMGNRIVDTQVQLIDIMPTVLDLLGIEVPNQIQGRSLLPLIYSNTKVDSPAFSELYSLISVRYQNFHFIYNIRTGREELYDLKNDPFEQVNLAEELPEKREEFKQIVFSFIQNNTRKN